MINHVHITPTATSQRLVFSQRHLLENTTDNQPTHYNSGKTEKQ